MDSRRFIQLWNRHRQSGSSDCANDLFLSVEKHYNESHRQYHTTAHIDHCLKQVDMIDVDLECRDAVELAIWFHDVIYEIGDPLNEERSAEFFMEVSAGQLDDDLRCQVQRLILITRHKDTPTLQDEKLVVDIDLSGFGMPWDEFAADSARVRDEFPDISDREFEEKHVAFLEMLANRRYFYSTDLFRSKYEDQAKINIKTKLKNLSAASSS